MATTTTEKQLPIGNGGKGPNYTWTQTLKEAQVTIPVPAGTNSKEIKGVFDNKSAKVMLKGEVVFQVCVHFFYNIF